MTKTVFLWDIDGTLLLTGGSGKASFERVFNELYGEHDIWGDYRPHGKTDYLIIRHLYTARFGRMPDASQIGRIAWHYRKCAAEDIPGHPGFRLMPYVRETLEKLHARTDMSLGLITGNFKEAAYLKLKHGGLDHFFPYGGFGCDHIERDEVARFALRRAHKHIGGKPAGLYLVGDTTMDVQCGKAIGAKTIAVCTSGSTPEELARAGADHVIKDLSEFGGIGVA